MAASPYAQEQVRCVATAHRVHEIAGRGRIAVLHVYPAACMFIHHRCLVVPDSSTARAGFASRVRGAHIIRFFVVTQDHGGVSTAGLAVMLSRLPDG